MSRPPFPAALAALLPLFACGQDDTPAPGASPRPVRVTTLREQAPLKDLTITGSVHAWKEEDVASEVDGRVTWIAEPGKQLQGRWIEANETVLEGDLLARIDVEPFTIRRDSAAASVTVADRKLAVSKLKKEKVLPASKKAAEAERDRAQAEWERTRDAAERNAVSGVELIRVTAERDSAAAKLEEANADFDTEDANIKTLEAQVDEAKLKQRQAQLDLDHCTLFAPFSGEVSSINVEAGGFAARGSPVAHLVMMDPIRIDIALSDEAARLLHPKQSLSLLLPGRDEPARGVVYEKSTVADANTRTFRVSILTRNERTRVTMGQGADAAGLAVVSDFIYLMRSRAGDPDSPYFVEERRALFRDGDSWFVWACPDRTMNDTGGSARVRLQKFKVELGEQRLNYQGLYLFRELRDTGGLEPGALIALDVPDGVQDGDEVLLARSEWSLKPGQIVDVIVADSPHPSGLWAPMSSIQPVGESTGAVFVEDGGVARRVKITIHESAGEKFRIEAETPEGGDLLRAGASLILDGIHFLEDGEDVRVVQALEQRP